MLRAVPRLAGIDTHGFSDVAMTIPAAKLDSAAESLRPFMELRQQFEAESGSCRTPSRYTSATELQWYLRDGSKKLLQHRPSRLAHAPIPVSYVDIDLGHQKKDAAFGRALNFTKADSLATFEALERQSSVYRQQRPVFTASYKELQCRVRTLAPETLILPDCRSSLHSVTYHETLNIDWTPAYSFRHQETVLVPARSAFLGYGRDPAFMTETSNGSALGGSMEEAMLHALLEVVERDAFLFTWYAKRPPVSVNVDTITDRDAGLLIDCIQRLGYEVRVYRTTIDVPVASVWIKAVHPKDNGFKCLSSGGAHMDPIKAVTSALMEVITSLALMAPRFDPVKGQTCQQNPSCVKNPMDHMHLFGLPEQFQKLAFLDQGSTQPFAVAFAADASPWMSNSITDKLLKLITQLLEYYPDVLFVNQTLSDLERAGVYCVKAILPDALPMTFGHVNRRVRGCQRLQRYLNSALAIGQIHVTDGFLPHPFP